MDKETLSNYGWIVICVLVLAVMLALATPFGTFVADGFKATYTGLFQTGDNALDMGLSAVGVSNKLPCGHGRKEVGDHSQKECGHYNCQDTDCGCVPASCGIEGHWSGDNKGPHGIAIPKNGCYSGHRYTCECTTGWKIPEGGTYTVNQNYKVDGKYVYTAGETLPCGYAPITSDKYHYNDYEYSYNTTRSISGSWTTPGPGEFWSVAYIGTSNAPGAIISHIAGKAVQYMEGAFAENTYITDISKLIIPETITSMYRAFYGCTSLTNVNGFVIPSQVTNMNTIFFGCTSLVDASGIVIEDGEHNMGAAFRACTSLEKAPYIPSQTTTIHACFYQCPLKESVHIPCSLNGVMCDGPIQYYHVDGCSGSCGK